MYGMAVAKQSLSASVATLPPTAGVRASYKDMYIAAAANNGCSGPCLLREGPASGVPWRQLRLPDVALAWHAKVLAVSGTAVNTELSNPEQQRYAAKTAVSSNGSN